LNSIIVSMLMTRRPDEVRMLMIDPKMVELTPYKALPHLMHPVVTDMKKAEAILAWAVEKMEERYTMLAKVGVRHLSQYNQLGREELLKRFNPETDEEAAAIPTTMPYIVMIADEIADMMMTAGKEIEQHIIRLAQKSRAVGIHLILATQKPTVDVITGLIKSNLPARIAFQVASRTDSRVVLDECGAERLLGNGDMLFLSPGTSQILRGQGTYLSDEEIGRVMAAIGTTEPQYAAELVNLQPAPSGDAPKGSAGKDRDEMYEAAVEVVIREGRGSVSLLQRALGVGYGRGARLIDFMAEDGVVGQYAGSQAREVLITMDQWAERNGTTAPAPDPAPRRLKIQPHAKVVEQFEEIEEDDEEAADREEAFARLEEEDDSDSDSDDGDRDEEEADDDESYDLGDEDDGEYEDAEDEDDSDEGSDDDD
jgi:S-DNA-T family DNA segregation ATPase FtsK/SpoIIIE